MKARSFLIGCMTLGLASSSFAQVEYDDMYFNAKDRNDLNATKASEAVAVNNNKQSLLDDEFDRNPSDTYSARNVNPEHISRSKAKTAQEDEQDYYISNYQQQSAAGYNTWSNNYSNWSNNPWYTSSWYSPAFNSWHSPYYSPYYSAYNSPYSWYSPYDAWGSPWYDPYYGYGSMYGPTGYYGGSGWNFGMSYSFGYPYYPASLYSSGLGIGFGWYNSWYPRTTVVVYNNGDHPGRNVSYGKRPSRGSREASTYSTTSRTRDNVALPTYDRSNSGGRAVTSPAPVQSTRQEVYYNKNWRNASQNSPTRSGSYNSWSGSNSNNPSIRGSNSSNSYYRGSSSSGSTPSYSPARSSSSSGSSGGSRSSGSGSSGRSRGRD
jgi:hypothetical protein